MRPDRDTVVRTLGQRADEPVVVASLVGATAVVFSGQYYGNVAICHWGEYRVGEYDALVGLSASFVLTVGTAIGVTWVVWCALDPTGSWRYRYGLGAVERGRGARIDVLSKARESRIGWSWVGGRSLLRRRDPASSLLP